MQDPYPYDIGTTHIWESNFVLEGTDSAWNNLKRTKKHKVASFLIILQKMKLLFAHVKGK